MDNLIPRTLTPMCLMPQAPVHRAMQGVHTAGSVPCKECIYQAL